MTAAVRSRLWCAATLVIATTATGCARDASATAALVGESRGSTCEPQAPPAAVPAGWVEYTDWSCDCRFYVPDSRATLPAPIEWEPCRGAPDGLACETMVVDWTDDTDPIAFDPHLARDREGRPVLDFVRTSSRAATPYSLHMTADVDGPVRNAMLKVWDGESLRSPGCFIVNVGVADGRYVRKVRGDDKLDPASTVTNQGILGGDIDELHPTVLAHNRDRGPHGESWTASRDWLVHLGPGFALTAYPWDTSAGLPIATPATDAEHLEPSQLLAAGDAVFWTTATRTRAGLNVWDAVHGARPFVRFVGDASRGAADLGTDGIDLVWSYGEGKAADEETYASISVMTAPFTTDPDALQPRRLRALSGTRLGNDAWEVGCGYAIHDGGANDLVLVRLEDGGAWRLPSVGPDFQLHTAVGVTCDEVFALGRVGGRTNVARVRIDSLGEPAPHDASSIATARAGEVQADPATAARRANRMPASR